MVGGGKSILLNEEEGLSNKSDSTFATPKMGLFLVTATS